MRVCACARVQLLEALRFFEMPVADKSKQPFSWGSQVRPESIQRNRVADAESKRVADEYIPSQAALLVGSQVRPPARLPLHDSPSIRHIPCRLSDAQPVRDRGAPPHAQDYSVPCAAYQGPLPIA